MEDSNIYLKKKVSRRRCIYCKRKLSVSEEFLCKCGNTYCSLHLFFRSHNCEYNYRKEYDSNDHGLGGGCFEKINKI